MSTIRLLNPFAFWLERKERRFREIEDKPVYVNGEYRSYKVDKDYYVTCRRNLIVTETTGIPRFLIDRLVEGREPEDYRKHHYLRMLEAYDYAVECAGKVGFKII